MKQARTRQHNYFHYIHVLCSLVYIYIYDYYVNIIYDYNDLRPGGDLLRVAATSSWPKNRPLG